MKIFTVNDVVNKLIGDIHAHGVTEVDNKNYWNMGEMVLLIGSLLGELMAEADRSSAPEGSIKDSAEKALRCLESFRNSITVYLEERE